MTIQTKIASDPTHVTYVNLTEAYDYLNSELFAQKLPFCLITLQRKANCGGYFAGARFKHRNGTGVTDEIALNPAHFESADTRFILSILAHEMAHLQQYHQGQPGKGGYHNAEWGRMMLAIGLKPESLDQPGKMTGNKVSHQIVKGGEFDRACAKLMERGIQIDWVEAWTEGGKAKAKAKLKVKYTCGGCATNCWAKPDCRFVCGECDEEMKAEG